MQRSWWAAFKERACALCFIGKTVPGGYVTSRVTYTSRLPRGPGEGRERSLRTMNDGCGLSKALSPTLRLRFCSLRHRISYMVIGRESGHANLCDTVKRRRKTCSQRSNEMRRHEMGTPWSDRRGDRSIEKKQYDTHIGLSRGLERLVASSRNLRTRIGPLVFAELLITFVATLAIVLIIGSSANCSAAMQLGLSERP